LNPAINVFIMLKCSWLGVKIIILFAITHLVNCVVAEGRISNDWSLSFVINCFKGKGDALERGITEVSNFWIK